MRPKTDHAELLALVTRLERTNGPARAADPCAGTSPAERVVHRARSSGEAAAVEASGSRTNSHASAYLGAGAVLLGLVFLLLLGQLGL